MHALGQTAHFSTDTPLDCNRLLISLNGQLPQAIRIKELKPTLETFHSQYSAISKEYHYHLWMEKIIDPFLHPYRHHFSDTRFSLSQLQEAALYFIGTQDFTTFTNLGSAVGSKVRTITRLDIIPQEGGLRLEFEGNGFLYKMVRNIVGTLLEVSIGKKTPTQIPQLFAALDRRVAGAAAPAKGLFLVNVNYAECFLNNSENEEKWGNSLPNVTPSSLISEESK